MQTQQDIIHCLKLELESGYKPTLANFYIFLVRKGVIVNDGSYVASDILEEFLKWKK